MSEIEGFPVVAITESVMIDEIMKIKRTKKGGILNFKHARLSERQRLLSDFKVDFLSRLSLLNSELFGLKQFLGLYLLGVARNYVLSFRDGF